MREGLVGLLGGTFNPIHYGHLMLASFAYDEFKLSKVIFIPNRTPPHRPSHELAPAEDRLEMVKLAISGDERFNVSDLELRREGPSYTYYTVLEMKREYPKLAFICGKDTLMRNKWYNLQGILEELELLIVAERMIPQVVGGVLMYPPPSDLERELLSHPILRAYSHKLRTLNMPLVDISSTLIRERLRRGLSIRYLLPPEVEEYILRRGLYVESLRVRGERA